MAKSSIVGSQNKKASVLYLSKEANSKDTELKTMMVSSLQNDESKGTENLWKQNCFLVIR